MHIGAFTEQMERIAPPEIAEDFDLGRIGLIVEGRQELGAVCCALDATPRVVAEAAALGAGMLVVHHTPIWRPITAIRGGTSRLLRELLAADMNLFVMHTNFDNAPGGVNDTLADLLEFKNRQRMSTGIVGDLSMTLQELAKVLGCGLRVFGNARLPARVAVVGGSGFDPCLFAEAAAFGAEAFLSAELKHSVFLESPLPCIEATHYALEAPAMRVLAGRMGWHYIDDPPHCVIVP